MAKHRVKWRDLKTKLCHHQRLYFEEENGFYYHSNNKLEKHVSLLLIQDHYDDEDERESEINDHIRYYYVLIKDLSRLLTRQLSKDNSKKYVYDVYCWYFY